MKLLFEEFFKVFIKRKLLFLLIALLIYEFLSVYSKAESVKLKDVEAQSRYELLFEQFEGEITEEKTVSVENLGQTVNTISKEKQTLNEQFISRQINEDEYQEKLLEYEKKVKGINGVRLFTDEYLGEMLQSGFVFNQKPWGVLFGKESIDFFFCVFLLLFSLLLIVSEEESGIKRVVFPTPNGKGAIWFVDILLIVVVSFLTSFLISGVRYFSVNVCYPLHSQEIPFYYLEQFQNSRFRFSLQEAYFAVSFVKALGAVFFSLTVAAIGMMSKQALITSFLSFLVIFLPGYVFSSSYVKYLIPLPSALLTANGFFFGMRESYGTVFSNEISNVQLLFVAMSIAVIMGIEITVTYFLMVRRKHV